MSSSLQVVNVPDATQELVWKARGAIVFLKIEPIDLNDDTATNLLVFNVEVSSYGSVLE